MDTLPAADEIKQIAFDFTLKSKSKSMTAFRRFNVSWTFQLHVSVRCQRTSLTLFDFGAGDFKRKLLNDCDKSDIHLSVAHYVYKYVICACESM